MRTWKTFALALLTIGAVTGLQRGTAALQSTAAPAGPANRLIVYGEDARPPVPNVNWLLEAGTKLGQERKPILAVNNFYAMLRAVLSGLGIAALSDFIASEHSELVRVLPELTGPPVEAYFVYPEELRTSKRISVFRDFLLRKVAETRLS